MKLAKSRCLQISVAAQRWPDAMLDGLFSGPGNIPLTAEQSRGYLGELKNQGYTVVPCNRHKCDDTGECSGISM